MPRSRQSSHKGPAPFSSKTRIRRYRNLRTSYHQRSFFTAWIQGHEQNGAGPFYLLAASDGAQHADVSEQFAVGSASGEADANGAIAISVRTASSLRR